MPLVEREPWMEVASCRGLPPEMFVPPYNPEHKEGPSPEAFLVCATCKVTKECLAYGRKYKCSGCWGGVALQQGRHRRDSAGGN